MASAKRSKIPLPPPILSDFPPDNIMDVHNWRNTSTTHINTNTFTHKYTHRLYLKRRRCFILKRSDFCVFSEYTTYEMCDVIIDVIENSKVYFQLQFMANISNFFLALFSRLENSSRLCYLTIC